MKQSQPKAILVYGSSQKHKAKNLSKLLVIDISYAGWREEMEEQIGCEIDESLFYCTPQAYMVARKRLSSHTVIRVDNLEDIDKDPEETGNHPAAARIGDMIVSKKFHPSVKESKAWLSSYHLGLIKELFKEGFVLEILDEQNNPITTIGENK